MTQYKTQIKIASLVLGLISYVAINHYNQNYAVNSETPETYESVDYASMQRATVLGKPVVTENLKQETDILLTLAQRSQKWDLQMIDSPKAWKNHETLGSRDVVVAIIDTGMDIYHKDLSNNLWKNPGETGKDLYGKDKATNRIDDDGNGLTDDVYGWNFVDNNSSLTDNHGHGTHIAGIIGAHGDKSKLSVVGVSPKVSLMVLKYYDPKSPGRNNLSNTVKAIKYAVDMKQRANIKSMIINYSGGGLDRSLEEENAIALARKAGILFVAAAGNERSNSDVKGYYPADYDLDNIISVTAVDHEKNILPSSNYGSQTVDIAAPGNDIYSTLNGNQYGYLTGTSQATASVTGVAALIMAKYPELPPKKVVSHLTETGSPIPAQLIGKTRYNKILNTYRALAVLDQGMSVNGTIAKNTGNIKPKAFSLEVDPTPNNNADETFNEAGNSTDTMFEFSKSMQQIVLKSQKDQLIDPVENSNSKPQL